MGVKKAWEIVVIGIGELLSDVVQIIWMDLDLFGFVENRKLIWMDFPSFA